MYQGQEWYYSNKWKKYKLGLISFKIIYQISVSYFEEYLLLNSQLQKYSPVNLRILPFNIKNILN